MVNIRVNTRKEKRALAQLSLALSVIGVSLDDLKNIKETVEENRRLRIANDELTEKLIKATGGKTSPKDDPTIMNYLKGPETIKFRKDGREASDAAN